MRLAMLLSLLGASAAISANQRADITPLTLQQSIPLPGVKGKFDHVAIDLVGQRVFIAAKVNNTLEVVDLKGATRLGSVAGFREPQGVLYLPDTKEVVVANGGNGEVQFLDGSSLNVIKRVSFTADADNLRYEPQARLVYVAAQDGVLGAIDLQTMRKLPEIKLPGHPEAFAIESGGRRLFVNVPKTDSIFVIDRSKSEVIGRWQLTKAKVNYTMAFDGPQCTAALAQIYAWTGELDEAFRLLDHLVTVPNGVAVPLLKLDPAWDPLRKDPRYQALIDKYEANR